MQHTTGYDGDLQMYRERPHRLDLAHLRFLRWLAEQGRLEHQPAGPPAVELAEGQRLAEYGG